MIFRIPRLASLTESEVLQFREDGYLVVESWLDKEQLQALRESFSKLFSGQFATGVFPDEWHWREGISLPDVTRHIANAWKADLAVAGLALSRDVGRAGVLLSGWSGVRLGQDTVWWKPPGAKSVTLHQAPSFLDYLDPPQSITCWVALDDTSRSAGTLEYVPGSHLWPLTPISQDFLAPDDYHGPMRQAGAVKAAPVYIEVPAGSCVFLHCSEIWHGSGPTGSDSRMRRSIGVHCCRRAYASPNGTAATSAAINAPATPRSTRASFRFSGAKMGAAPTGSRATLRSGRREAPRQRVSAWSRSEA